jgi:hypothetical protein
MNRRDFLKLGGLFSTALLVQFNPLGKIASLPSEARAGGRLYRGTQDGRIFVSENAGKSWQLHTNFGLEFSVLGMTADVRDNIHALLEFSGHGFQLALSPNGKVWRTA